MFRLFCYNDIIILLTKYFFFIKYEFHIKNKVYINCRYKYVGTIKIIKTQNDIFKKNNNAINKNLKIFYYQNHIYFENTSNCKSKNINIE